MITVKQNEINTTDAYIVKVIKFCKLATCAGVFKFTQSNRLAAVLNRKKEDTKNVGIIICQVESTAVASVFV